MELISTAEQIAIEYLPIIEELPSSDIEKMNDAFKQYLMNYSDEDYSNLKRDVDNLRKTWKEIYTRFKANK